MCIIRLFVQLDFRSPAGYDRTRGVEIGNKNFKLTHLEEAYTSEHWLVRIYKVKDLVNREKVQKPTIPGQKWKKKSSKKVCFSEIQKYTISSMYILGQEYGTDDKICMKLA